ncbi:MAG: VPDSG-CTERM sorting domain-containing protein [Chthoniobacterales bacterium]|nr:VPDSG-CTERM sorting domain-containing protein [Chthoniobacterales bacterium]
MKLTKTILAVVAATVIGGLASTAQAVMIQGTVGFQAPNGGTASQSNGVTTIDFAPPVVVNFATGDYSGTEGSTAFFANISFSGSGTDATLLSNNTPQYSFTSGGKTFSFDLTKLISATFTPGTFSLSGLGVARITGFEDTRATFSVQGTGNGFRFTLLQASETAPAPGGQVPDGGSAIALLGIAIVGIEGLRRKFATA